MLGMLIVGFFSLNILLSLLFLGLTFWKGETGAQKIMAANGISAELATDPYVQAFGYEIILDHNGEKGLRLPGFLQSRLPLNVPDARRGISLPGADSQKSLLQRLEEATYHMIFTVDGVSYRISYALGADLRIFFIFILILLGGQCFFFLGRIWKNPKVIRQTLKPLSEMAETARNLRQDMSSMRPTPSGAGIKHLAGAINTISAERLDQELSIDSSQEELKDLAYAINDMLRRINRAYQSQIRFVSDDSHELRTPISCFKVTPTSWTAGVNMMKKRCKKPSTPLRARRRI